MVTAIHSWTYLKNILSVFYFVFLFHPFGDETHNDFPLETQSQFDAKDRGCLWLNEIA